MTRTKTFTLLRTFQKLPSLSSGRASIYILRTAFGLDWSERIRVIYAGDDNTDEDAMQVSSNFRIRAEYVFKDSWSLQLLKNAIR